MKEKIKARRNQFDSIVMRRIMASRSINEHTSFFINVNDESIIFKNVGSSDWIQSWTH